MMVKSNNQLKTLANKIKAGEVKRNPSIGNSLFITVAFDKKERSKDKIDSISIHFRYTSCLTGQRTSILVGKSDLYDETGISIDDAIEESVQLKKLNKLGIDPKQKLIDERNESINKAKNPETKFGYFAEAYLDKNKPLIGPDGKQITNAIGQPIGWSQKHYDGQKGRLENHIQPHFKDRQITEISKGDLVRFCNESLKEGTHSWSTVDKFIAILSGAFEEASLDLQLINPATNLRQHIRKEFKAELQKPHINPYKYPERFGEVITGIYSYTKTSASVLLAMRLAPHLFLRTENLVSLRWEWVSSDKKTIVIPKSHTKNKNVSYAPDLVIPLSTKALQILQQARSFNLHSEFVFPSNTTSKHITDNCLRKNYNSLGYREQQSMHGFRHSAKTWLKEKGFSSEATELQLHHVRSKIEETYDGSELLLERSRMMQSWSDFISQYAS